MDCQFVINLPSRTDRLWRFQHSVPPFLGPVTVWPAVDGSTSVVPSWWKHGPGAWGCYQSHVQIFEHCRQQGVESYLVFEDDAIFRSDFAAELVCFVDELPDDWQQSYLGGQLLKEIEHPPQRISEYVFRPFNVNRLHAYAVHSRGFQVLHEHLATQPHPEDHIDHHFGRLHERDDFRVYCPRKWIVGQSPGKSDISGEDIQMPSFWVDPERVIQRLEWAKSA